MGEYTALAIKGVVKAQFRKFTDALIEGNWGSVPDPYFEAFSKVHRSNSIPRGFSYYFNSELCVFADVDCEQADPFYDIETGEYHIYCSLKNYDNTIQEFFKLIPHFMQECSIIRTRYNGYDSPICKYELADNEVRFIEAEPFDEWD